eukprot:GHVH01002999.1.p1 GENE.GHVH01002999.1~~GHVH01002999.1.p1  ORF type:complete len:367 (-),score=30.81 GHVH01002999.1:68-1168(-)
MEIRIAGRYRLGRKLGSGSFGEIYMGRHCVYDEDVAIKLEGVRSRHPQLLYESKLYKILNGGIGIPNIYWYGIEGDYNVMVMELLGPSLEDLFLIMGRQFSLKTVLMIADQTMNRVEYVHSKSFLHRDIKPDNFVIGRGRRVSVVYVIDFGLAKKFRDPRTMMHIPYREGKHLTGTARYASISTHLGIEQGRRDDLEAIGYVLLYFLRGSLPWQGLKAGNKKDKYDKIMEKKMSTPIEMLCRGLPFEFCTYMNYVRSLRFEDRPDYGYLRRLLKDLFFRQGLCYNFIFDWSARIKPSWLDKTADEDMILTEFNGKVIQEGEGPEGLGEVILDKPEVTAELSESKEEVAAAESIVEPPQVSQVELHE